MTHGGLTMPMIALEAAAKKREGDYDGAHNRYLKAIAAFQEDTDLLYGFGNLLYIMGKYELSAASYLICFLPVFKGKESLQNIQPDLYKHFGFSLAEIPAIRELLSAEFNFEILKSTETHVIHYRQTIDSYYKNSGQVPVLRYPFDAKQYDKVVNEEAIQVGHWFLQHYLIDKDQYLGNFVISLLEEFAKYIKRN
jgi:tetratricopeptide (TPR) repeat protein